jgi:hypothetical protein
LKLSIIRVLSLDCELGPALGRQKMRDIISSLYTLGEIEYIGIPVPAYSTGYSPLRSVSAGELTFSDELELLQ